MSKGGLGLILAVILLASLACNASEVLPGIEGSQATASPVEPIATEDEPTAVPTRVFHPAEPGEALVWFSPLPPSPGDDRGVSGSDEYMALFEDDAAWVNAASKVDVLKLYGGWVAREASIRDLEKIVEFADRHRMALAFEAGPLPPRKYCKSSTPPEGFAGVKEGRDIARRIKEAGGRFDYFAFDAAIANSHINTGEVGCQWPLERVAQETQEYVDFIREQFPGIVIGDTDPLWQGVDVQTYKDWISTYQRVNGEPLAFFHLDTQWSRSSWPQDAREIEQFAAEQGVDFGIIYFGDADDTSDSAWLRKAEDRMVTFESLMGGTPEHALLQSWHDHPDKLLPDSDPEAFTNLINRYARERTEMTVDLQAQEGVVEAAGSLAGASGEPRSGVSIEYQVVPESGQGVAGEYFIQGQVPAGVTEANLGLRINRECGCSSQVELQLYQVEYIGSTGANQAPNPRFASGAWGFNGDAEVRAVASDQGGGLMMEVAAEPSQGAIINGPRFSVSAGADFSVRWRAKVAPTSVDGGYLAIFFLGESGEIRRVRLPLEPAAASQGSVRSESSGAFEWSTGTLPTGGYRIHLWAEGDASYWPAAAEAQVEVSP